MSSRNEYKISDAKMKELSLLLEDARIQSELRGLGFELSIFESTYGMLADNGTPMKDNNLMDGYSADAVFCRTVDYEKNVPYMKLRVSKVKGENKFNMKIFTIGMGTFPRTISTLAYQTKEPVNVTEIPTNVKNFLESKGYIKAAE